MAPVAAKNTTNKSTEKFGINSTCNRICKQPQQPGLSYALFMHCQEVRRSKSSLFRTSLTKYQLTDELIMKSKKNIYNCSSEDLQIISRETIFKKNLTRQMVRMRYWQMMKEEQNHKGRYQKILQFNKQNEQQQLLQQQQPNQSTTIATTAKQSTTEKSKTDISKTAISSTPISKTKISSIAT